jgi:hypothetical protein
MAEIGQKRSLAGASPKGCFRIRKRTFEPIAAAQNDLFVGYVGFAIWKRKQLVGAAGGGIVDLCQCVGSENDGVSVLNFRRAQQRQVYDYYAQKNASGGLLRKQSCQTAQ